MSKVLMVASEATPFCKTGGLADVVGALPPALAVQGDQVAVVLPAYSGNHYPTAPKEVWRNLWVPLGGGFLVDIWEVVERGVLFYFVNCPQLYNREGIYTVGGWDISDNYLRFAVLSMAATGVARNLFRPDVVHCHDWQTALVPLYLRENFRTDPTFFSTKLLLTIHNLGYQGEFVPEVLPQISVDAKLFHPGVLEFYGKVNYLKGGIHYSDAVSTVSKGYAREIQTPEYGFGLDGYLRQEDHLCGILNGVDYSEWSPETDPHIASQYSAEDLSGKLECKRALLAEFGFPPEAMDRPLIGIVSRFAEQKGFDLIAEIAWPLLNERDATLVVLGSGDRRYEDMFHHIAAVRPDKAKIQVGYDNALAHRIEAGADIFLMPSRYEPSGLNQMYSLRYGTVPVVRATGGLDDTIDDGTGFKFWEYSGRALFDAIDQALVAFTDPGEWRAMMQRGMEKDFSWTASAAEYSELYRTLRSV